MVETVAPRNPIVSQGTTLSTFCRAIRLLCLSASANRAPGSKIHEGKACAFESDHSDESARFAAMDGGLWPDKYMPLIPETLVVYIAFHLVTEIWALVELPDRTAIALIMCSLEFVFMFTMFLLFILIRFNNHLKPLIDNMRREMEEEKIFKNNTEKNLYLRYNAISYNFGKYSLMLQCGLVSLIFFRPLIHLLGRSFAEHGNGTVPYEMPYINHMFFDYEYDAGVYVLLYLWETPTLYMPLVHIAEVSLIVTLSLHLCGKFSILSYRIRTVPAKPADRFQENIKSLVQQHLKLTMLTKNLNQCFYLILLVEYLSCTLRMGLCMYIVLINLRTDSVAAINFTMYAVNLAALLYLYSYVGEQFVYESEDLAAALYDTEWPEVMNKDRRTLLTCLVNGQRTEYLTAGKFYKFSLFGFTDMMKFSMGFISMLQARME